MPPVGKGSRPDPVGKAPVGKGMPVPVPVPGKPDGKTPAGMLVGVGMTTIEGPALPGKADKRGVAEPAMVEGTQTRSGEAVTVTVAAGALTVTVLVKIGRLTKTPSAPEVGFGLLAEKTPTGMVSKGCCCC